MGEMIRLEYDIIRRRDKDHKKIYQKKIEALDVWWWRKVEWENTKLLSDKNRIRTKNIWSNKENIEKLYRILYREDEADSTYSLYVVKKGNNTTNK